MWSRSLAKVADSINGRDDWIFKEVDPPMKTLLSLKAQAIGAKKCSFGS